jgi:hypothetical protein
MTRREAPNFQKRRKKITQVVLSEGDMDLDAVYCRLIPTLLLRNDMEEVGVVDLR